MWLAHQEAPELQPDIRPRLNQASVFRKCDHFGQVVFDEAQAWVVLGSQKYL